MSRTAASASGRDLRQDARRLTASLLSQCRGNRCCEIPDLTERYLRTSLGLDGELDDESLNEYLRRVMTPAADAR